VSPLACVRCLPKGTRASRETSCFRPRLQEDSDQREGLDLPARTLASLSAGCACAPPTLCFWRPRRRSHGEALTRFRFRLDEPQAPADQPPALALAGAAAARLAHSACGKEAPASGAADWSRGGVGQQGEGSPLGSPSRAIGPFRPHQSWGTGRVGGDRDDDRAAYPQCADRWRVHPVQTLHAIGMTGRGIAQPQIRQRSMRNVSMISARTTPARG
jgi:hypothetical protein